MLNKNKIIILVLCSIFILQCTGADSKSSSKRTRTKSGSVSQADEVIVTQKFNELRAEQDKILISGTLEEIDRVILENALLKSFNQWKGTRYQWGGDSKSGIDCSALTRRIYRDVFNYELPRVSVDQVKVGRRVNTRDLKAGDILYFRPEGRVNHTAVYLGNSIFLNASSSSGVILSSLESGYWGRYFLYGIRVDAARSS